MVDLCLKRLDTMKVTNEISYSMTKLPCLTITSVLDW